MQFTRLRLQGFKSFVDPTELVIGPGLTGVVGPNGCGKSNLLEALRWVMGEQRAKAMRGQGMDDVIFAGSGKRPAKNTAQVALTLSAAPGEVPALFGDVRDLEVSRRITRDIGSAFTVNGKPVRARDVAMLFADASTGAQSPSLVRQGQIGELIASRPTARRRVIEEAAGIAGLYQRRHEAELKLSATSANLGRVDELIGGLDGRLKALARQAAQARRYRQLAEELRRVEAALFYHRWAEAAAGAAAAEQALSAAMASAAEAETKALGAEQERQRAEHALEPLREEAMVAAAVCQRLAIKQDEHARDAARAAAAFAALGERLQQLEDDRSRETALGAEAETTLSRLAGEAAQIRAALAQQEGTEEEAARHAEAAEVARASAEAEHDSLAAAAARLSAECAAARQAADRAEAAAQRSRAGRDALAQDRAATEAAAEAASAEAARRTEAAEAAQQAARRAREEHAACESARHAAAVAEAAARTARAELESRSAALLAERDALQDVLDQGGGPAEGLIDTVRVAPGYEAALAAALGDDLELGVVPRGGGSGWAGAPAALGARPELPAGASQLGQWVTAPDALGARLSQVGVVESGRGAELSARLGWGQRLVSPEGDLWRWDGFCRVGGEAPSATARRLQMRNRLAALKEDCTAASADAASAETAHRASLTAAEAAQHAEAAARKAAEDAAKAADIAVQTASKLAAEREVAAGRAVRLREDLDRADAALEAALAEAGAAGEVLSALADPRERDAELAAARTQVETARAHARAAAAKRDEIRRDGAARRRRLAAIDRERKDWAGRASSAVSRLATLDARIAQAMADRDEGARQPERLAQEADRLARDHSAADLRRAAADAALREAEAALSEAGAAARLAERAAGTARERRAAAEADSAAAEARQEEALALAEGELQVEPSAAPAVFGFDPEAQDLASAELEASRLRRQRDALGPVNLRAEADSEELDRERVGLAAERDDLAAAVEKLRGGVRALNKEGRERLLAAFEAVNLRFGELFRHLFSGGEARLILVDSEDPLEAGLEILCQPPGKKLSTLSLLSGGEQTLTALSLIFAVFLCNPAPVCVLDEVDAPLDDANVLRFCGLLDEMVRQTETRFLIITHHAITMSRMDRLFGVTMMERGVSRLVSVDLAESRALVDG